MRALHINRAPVRTGCKMLSDDRFEQASMSADSDLEPVVIISSVSKLVSR